MRTCAPVGLGAHMALDSSVSASSALQECPKNTRAFLELRICICIYIRIGDNSVWAERERGRQISGLERKCDAVSLLQPISGRVCFFLLSLSR